ncbi:programmed cell death protein 4a isoform X2 [Neoarius graeffei]|uniref:programmed cell death protein 4a isoform X2 n=1 Tax=Neoarius graeffei TaxID=443677 RepID=UPI00298CA737|nr:programmed cell death protein 4a isoform X2 [Neoarius graeffei]
MAAEVEAWSCAAQRDGVLSVGAELDGESESVYDEELIESEVNGNWTPQEKALHEARLKAKAKRRLRKSSSRDSTHDSLSECVSGEAPNPHSPKGKTQTHDRKSRMGKGRGLPKKGGAGGKGVWGAAGLVYEMEEPDCKDPNYDESAQGDTVYATVVPELEEGELEKVMNPIIQEYFEHGDTKEVEMLLKDLNLGPRQCVFPSLAVCLSLECKASQRELTSRLLSDLITKQVINEGEMTTAFNHTLSQLPELILDTPDAPQMLGQFIARAIADHALPMDFLDQYKGKVDCEHARAALDRASVLLSMKRETVRLDNVWGVGGGQRPVKLLIKEMNLLLKEYLVSGELLEADHCLRDLEVPHFHHELVYEAVLMVLESHGDAAIQPMVKLLQSFWKSGLITLDQMNRGFQRVYDELPEISLDVPHAHSIMETFVDVCHQQSIITKQLRDACPFRGRKRFMSEGDGGIIKS